MCTTNQNQKQNQFKVFLPRELQVRIGRLAAAIAVRQREQDRAIDEAVTIHAAFAR